MAGDCGARPRARAGAPIARAGKPHVAVARRAQQNIADHRETVLRIELQDVADFSFDGTEGGEVAAAIERNTLRYLSLLGEAADEAMPKAIRDPYEFMDAEDLHVSPLDLMMRSRIARARESQEGGGEVSVDAALEGIPPELRRRCGPRRRCCRAATAAAAQSCAPLARVAATRCSCSRVRSSRRCPCAACARR